MLIFFFKSTFATFLKSFRVQIFFDVFGWSESVHLVILIGVKTQGGGSKIVQGEGVLMLIPLESCSTYVFLGVLDPISPSRSANVLKK